MNTYLLLKTLHIISSVLLVGTGFGSAFYLYFTHRSNNLAAIATVTRLVVIADWCFTTPAVIIQPLSGIAMMYLAGWQLDTPWIMLSIAPYLLAGACWLPVVWLQIQMKGMAEAAKQQGTRNKLICALLAIRTLLGILRVSRLYCNGHRILFNGE